MSANFTPGFENYTGQGKFRFWCQTVLPLIYDDSLSYMELLNKMVVYLNNTIQDVATMETNVDALLTAYNNLQEYVNDYFDNLDVQNEINHKLDVMAEDGSLSNLIHPFIDAGLPGLVETNLPGVVENQIGVVVANQIDDVVGEQIGGVVSEQIPTQVTGWLNDNVTPVGSAVIVDNSLSISGAAADAKVTGDELSDLKNAINKGCQILTSANFTQGTWSGGAISTAPNRICTNVLYPVKKGDKIYIKTNSLEIAHGIYESGATASTDYKTWHSASAGETYIVPLDGSIFFQLKKSDNSSVAPSDYDATVNVYNNEISRLANDLELTNIVVSDILGNLVDYGFTNDAFNYKVTTLIDINIIKNSTKITVNGFNSSGSGVRIRVNNLTATYDSADVAAWSTGLVLKPGHTYVAENKLISGHISLSGNATKPTMSVYATGTTSSAGNAVNTETGSKRFFTAQYGKQYNVVLYVNVGTTLNDAVYEVILLDITEELASATKSVRAYTNASYSIGQSCAYIDGYVYVYHSDSPAGISKVNIHTGEATEYPLDLGHGNDMTIYNGNLYICDMNEDGTIHIVSLETMTETSSVDFTVDGVKIQNSAIAHDAVNNQFIIKSDNKFYFADTTLTYKSSVDISYIDSATSQGITTDGYYIYWVKSSPNTIEIFDFEGNFIDSIKISSADEPESLVQDTDGGWWLLTNVVGGGWYFDAIQITKNLNIGSISSLIKAISAI